MRIVVLTHAEDDLMRRGILLQRLFPAWEAAGHTIAVARGLDAPDGDVAFLHIDLSVIPADYLALAARYPRVVNGRVTDIRKRAYSRNLVARGDGWTGPVVVKTDLNFAGLPERAVLAADRAAGRASDPTLLGLKHLGVPYRVFRAVAQVPDVVWDLPELVVERFLPEPDPRGFWMRTWVFLGDRGRSHRILGTHPIVKGANVIGHEPCDIPDDLHAERARLGFEYGAPIRN